MKKPTKDSISLNANWEISLYYSDFNIAIFFQNMVYWIRRNEATETNFIDGRYWTYNSIAAFEKQFPQLSYKTIRNMLDLLVKDGFLISGEYNTNRQDRTKWYALGDKYLKTVS